MGRQGDLLTLLDPNSVLTPEMREALIPMMAALLLEGPRDQSTTSHQRRRTGRWTMTKIATDHLEREAIVYIRQPTQTQLRNNH